LRKNSAVGSEVPPIIVVLSWASRWNFPPNKKMLYSSFALHVCVYAKNCVDLRNIEYMKLGLKICFSKVLFYEALCWKYLWNLTFKMRVNRRIILHDTVETCEVSVERPRLSKLQWAQVNLSNIVSNLNSEVESASTIFYAVNASEDRCYSIRCIFIRVVLRCAAWKLSILHWVRDMQGRPLSILTHLKILEATPENLSVVWWKTLFLPFWGVFYAFSSILWVFDALQAFSDPGLSVLEE